jgi:stress responsive alpha/beta barrel protein
MLLRYWAKKSRHVSKMGRAPINIIFKSLKVGAVVTLRARIRTCALHRNRLITLAFMIHHIVLYKLKPEVTPARVEAMMMNARMQLLKIPEVLSIKCGKRVDSELPWPFFIAIDFESMDKYGIFREDPIFVKFTEEIIKPNTVDSLVLDFEMDPGKDVRFS